MAVNRLLVATKDIKKGDTIANFYRSYNYKDQMSRFKILCIILDSIVNRSFTSEFIDWMFSECEKRGANNVMKLIAEESDIKIIDE